MSPFSSLSVFYVYYLLSYVCGQTSFNPTPRNQRGPVRPSAVMPRNFSPRAVAQAFQEADQTITTRRQTVSGRRRPPLDPRRDMASTRHNIFQRSRPRTRQLDTTQERFEEATRILFTEYDLSPEQIQTSLADLDLQDILQDNTVQNCQALFNFTCRRTDRFRTYDGTCNNLDHPSWGMASSCFERLVEPRYADGVSEHRGSVSGAPLPSPRTVSREIHSHLDNPTDYVTHLFMQFGQFLAHDITLTPLSTAENNQLLTCCPVQNDDPAQCDPILLDSDDPFYGAFQIDCLNNARSTICPTCTLGPRQQTNQVTSFIDLSLTYGSNLNDSRALRDLNGSGRLTVQNNFGVGDLLPQSSATENDGCSFQDPTLNCFQAGDNRVNQHLAVTSMHTMFMREHNRVAGRLRSINGGWNEDRIFEETRRILGAQMQAIVYKEYLPLVIGPERMEWFDLNVRQNGFTAYDSTVQPTLANEFSTAAFRFGHSTVNSFFPQPSQNSETVVRLRDVFVFPFGLYTGEYDRTIRGMTESPAQKFDRWIIRDVTNHLYQLRGNDSGLDLASLNINRGRDHGIPGYVEMVRFCGGPNIRSFRDLDRLFQRGASQLFQRLYETVEDIDFFSGGLAERPNQGAVIGPTFTCVIGIQFYHLKYGDRFYFEHGGQAGSFTQAQLRELRKTTISRIICDNTDMNEIQPSALMYSSNRNRVVRCSDLPEIDLRAWTE